MPVVLPSHFEEIWLDHGIEDLGLLAQMLVPADDAEMDAYQVSTLVNNVRNDGPGLIIRVT